MQKNDLQNLRNSLLFAGARAPLTAETGLVLLVQQLETGQDSASTLVTAAQRAAQSCGHWERETKE